jgi:LuxR family maltose regulon positive regulatory protein
MAAERARLWLRQLQVQRDNNLLQRVAAWVHSSRLNEDWRQPGPTVFLPNHPPDFEHLTLARAYMVQGFFDEADSLLAWLLEAAQAAGRKRSVVETALLQALTWSAGGQIEQAMTALHKALSLAAPVGYVRLFLDEGPPMAELLRQSMERGIAAGYAAQLLSALEAEERPSPAPGPSPPPLVDQTLVEPLSQRELEILHLIAAGLSNRETAEKLFIATSTVKKHLENIYGKLGVHSRTEAVAKARDLGIL